MNLRIEPFAGEPAAWDTFVRSCGGWTHFHLQGWRSVISEVFGHECLYLSAWDTHDQLVGVLPLVRVKSLVFGHYLVSMPFLNYGGPLGEHDAVRALADHAVDVAERDGARLLEFRGRTELPLDLDVSHRKITVLLDLPPGRPDELWSSFKPKLRTKVRRSQKEGSTLEFGPSQVKPFFDVFSRHMRDLGTPTLPLRFFEAIARQFPEDAWFGCVHLDGQPIACGCGFRWNDEFEMTWSSSLREFASIRPNMFLFWAFMERAAKEGLSVFNFGRSTPEGGTHVFKKGWDGARDVPLYWYQHARGESAKTPSPDDAAYSWGPRLWKRLPLGLATKLGPRIVRYIP